jgi:hypothetical protein
MTDKNIESFAEALVKLVRDRAIQNCSARLSENSKSPIGRAWGQSISKDDMGRVSNVIIPDCIDEAVFCLLNAIDEGGLNLTFSAQNGEVVNLTSEGLGELAGWYMGEDNWRERFSEERINNYLT